MFYLDLLPKDHPKLPFLKLILLYILEKRIKKFIIKKSELQDDAFYNIANKAINKTCSLIKKINGGGVRAFQLIENVIAEILPTWYVPTYYLTLKNIALEACDKPSTVDKIMQYLNIGTKTNLSGPGNRAKEFLTQANQKEIKFGRYLIDEIVGDYSQLIEFKSDKTNKSDPSFWKHLLLALQSLSINQQYKGLTLLGRCIENDAPLMINFLLREGVGFEQIIQPFNTEITAFLRLASFKQKILEQILINDPELVKKISIEVLCNYITYGENIYASAFYSLIASASGHQILDFIFQQNPKLVTEISVEALCRYRTTGNHANASPLYWLTSTPSGRQLLEFIFKQNPKLAAKIPAEALCRYRTTGIYANTSPLYWLASNRNSHPILKFMLQQNPKLATEISAAALCRHRTEGNEENASPLYWLVGSPSGRQILDLILQQNPILATEISAEVLCRHRTKGVYANISPLYWLAGTISGQKILDLLFKQNPTLTTEISAAALYLLIRKTNDADTSIFDWLTTTTSGHQVLQARPYLNAALALQDKTTKVFRDEIERAIKQEAKPEDAQKLFNAALLLARRKRLTLQKIFTEKFDSIAIDWKKNQSALFSDTKKQPESIEDMSAEKPQEYLTDKKDPLQDKIIQLARTQVRLSSMFAGIKLINVAKAKDFPECAKNELLIYKKAQQELANISKELLSLLKKVAINEESIQTPLEGIEKLINSIQIKLIDNLDDADYSDRFKANQSIIKEIIELQKSITNILINQKDQLYAELDRISSTPSNKFSPMN